ncbi:NUDIX hydrolase [Panacibacter sp. DH6]|uniref:NUDIX hydrolase n=1 Tax=Panacibacter microcysteis TaxID=2793269 RepID=A0A931MCY9_9BACT|nr:NUDIX hydrolase [Panacibacter microcysteis]MBG9378307.1 NUDIX hydrolase [Panacibacter microcysteis]
MGKLKICAGGFIMKENRFLFGRRSAKKKWAPGVWDIAGGHAETGEDIYDTLIRETFEETGIIVKNAELLTVTDVWDANNQDYFTYHIYMITAWEGQPANTSDEHTALAWFTLNELYELPLALSFYPMLIEKWMNAQASANIV